MSDYDYSPQAYNAKRYLLELLGQSRNRAVGAGMTKAEKEAALEVEEWEWNNAKRWLEGRA